MTGNVFLALWVLFAQAQQICAIAFEPGSSTVVLSDDDREQLSALVTWAGEHRDALIVVDGHAAEPALALRRAKAVERVLVATGANPQQIVVAAFGIEPQKPPRVVVWTSLRGPID